MTIGIYTSLRVHYALVHSLRRPRLTRGDDGVNGALKTCVDTHAS